MHPASQAREEGARVLLGCFEAAGRVVAIDVAELREVVRWTPPTPLPGAPALVEGVIDLRGALVPVVDLGRALGGEPAVPGRRTRIAVAEVAGLVVGLVVDAAVEILAVEGSALGDPPPLARAPGGEATLAVVRRAQGPMVAVLALEVVLEGLHRAALGRAGAEGAGR
jgi:purine-binding chemotaxis protein CheW